MKNYGEKITGYRKKVGLLQAELAEKLGVTRQAVSRWEHDVTEPDLESVKRMCRIFGITTDEFLFGEYVEYKDLRTAAALDDEENALTAAEQNGEDADEEIAAAEVGKDADDGESVFFTRDDDTKEKASRKDDKVKKSGIRFVARPKKKGILKLALNSFFALLVCAAVIVGNVVMYTFENQINSQLAPPITDSEELEATSANGQALSARLMEEGATLLRNENNVLPLDRQQDKKVNVFGWRSIDWIYGSEGKNASGGTVPENNKIEENIDIYKALNDYGVLYNEKLRQAYFSFRKPDLQSADLKGVAISELTPLCEPDIDDKKYYGDDLLSSAKEYSSVAIVVIGRMAGEAMNAELTQEKRGPTGTVDSTRHYLEISTEEEKLLKYVGANYEKVIVLLNVANPFECGFLEEIPGLDACVYLGFTGTRAVSVLPKLLYGETSFSGHTVDTFAYDMFTNPANVWSELRYTDYSIGQYEDYVEGVYVGYRWYETADKEAIWKDYKRTIPAGKLTGYNAVVQYPFGYGLSYNDYTWTIGDVSVAPGSDIDDKTVIEIPVKVKNNGKIPGREVVAAYVTVPYTPGGIEKSYVSLVAFTKTETINPGMEIEVTLTIKSSDFRSYDCYDKNNNGFKGYEIEKGNYEVKLMTDSHTVKKVDYKGAEQDAVFNYNVKETIKMPTDPVTGQTVKNLFTGEDAVDKTPIDADSKDGSFKANIPYLTRENFMKPSEFNEKHVARKATPIVTAGGGYKADRAKSWDNADVDVFGEPVNKEPVTWGKNNGLKLAKYNGGKITTEVSEFGEKLGKDYNAPEWNDLLDQLTIGDVLYLTNQYYGTKEVASIGKPPLPDLDGPSQIASFIERRSHGTGYPSMVTIASSWNPKLAYEFGKSFGDDMKSIGIYGVWGWAIDSHRSAFFGRNHESPSEDPMLAGTIIAQAVKGLNTRGRYSFIKHFALFGRGGQNKWLSEQAFREIHLEAFRKAFVEGGALGCMTTYQGVGGEHSETTEALLTGVLRKEWNFKGAVTTDYIGGNDFYCDAIIRSGGNYGMGVSLGTISGVSYNTSSSLRLQNRLRDVAHEMLYTWLRADYNEKEYLKNPDKDDKYISSSSIASWVWWKPFLTCVDVVAFTACGLWIGLVALNVFTTDDKKEATFLQKGV